MTERNQGKTWRLHFRERDPVHGWPNDVWAVAQNCSRADAVKIGKRQAEERADANGGGYWFIGVDPVEGATLL